jgi:methionyl-tRNA formyltransferase
MVSPAALRIIFFGTPEFAVPTLDALLAALPHTVVGVVTQPDRPRGRGQHVSHGPVKAHALAAGVPILQPERMKDPAFLERLAAWRADLGVVAAYGKILTDAVLAAPRLGMINVHASLLPRYRGAAPVHRAIIAGEAATGVTIMRVVRALDAGPMLAKDHRPIGPDETSADVERDLGVMGARLLVDVVDQIARGTVQATEQDESAATYAHRLTKDDGAVDWSWPAGRIHNLIRGLHPWPHAFTFHHGKRLILIRSTVRLKADTTGERHGDGRIDQATDEPGTIVEAAGDRLGVATGDGVLQVITVQAEGKRPMSVREFLAGHKLVAGDRLAPQPPAGSERPAPGTQPPAPTPKS